ncbi:MATE family efflux transporter [Labilibaculum sp.]|uniref:MATE family efflux transporter n=1 Tax=Labilibaculum sp. TaxID=2060723 RepID=UPI00356B15E2
MNQIKDLTSGNIFSQIVKLAIPIIATSFVQMAYNMTDMAWLGQVGSETVSAVGMALYMVWFGASLLFITKIGVEVGVSQSIGQKNLERAQSFARNAFSLSFVISIVFALCTWLFADSIINLFNIKNDFVNQTALQYLRIIAIGMPFTYSNITMSGVYNGVGNTKTPFWINAFGLIINIILDPILIFGWGAIPKMGAAGAGIATVISQLCVFILFIYFLHIKENPLNVKNYLGKIQKEFLMPILKVGGPVALQSTSFAFLAMFLARVMNNIAEGNPIPFSVQSIGAQIEALSWMTASGFSTALGTFTGQNYGANQWYRIQKGFFITLGIAGFIGIISTLLFFFWGDHIFNLFLNSRETDVVKMGIVYLIIISFSQVFMTIEITTTGAFNGIGKAMPPAFVGIIGNILRIPFAFLFSYSLLDYLPQFQNWIPAESVSVTGVWWGITLSSIIKGSILFWWFLLLLYKHPENTNPLPFQRFWIRIIPSRIRQNSIIMKPIENEKLKKRT